MSSAPETAQLDKTLTSVVPEAMLSTMMASIRSCCSIVVSEPCFSRSSSSALKRNRVNGAACQGFLELD
jgi:hypothetical protein